RSGGGGPGQNRLFLPDGEIFESQVRVCRLNGLRTVDFRPTLAPGDYLPAGAEAPCEFVGVGGNVQQNCKVQTGGFGVCPGNAIGDPPGTCLRVPDVET